MGQADLAEMAEIGQVLIGAERGLRGTQDAARKPGRRRQKRDSRWNDDGPRLARWPSGDVLDAFEVTAA